MVVIIAAFDVEATELIDPNIDDPNYQPAIMEFGAVKLRQNPGKMTVQSDLSILIDPERIIPDEVIKITGIRNEDIMGKPTFLTAFNHIAEFFTGVDQLISFNGSTYDLPVLMYNLRRYGLQYRFPWPRYHLDLMLAASDYTGMQGKTGNKPPKLVELHQHLFGEGFSNAHRALDDAKATMNCYLALKERGVL